jgi:hypothetical protein
MTAYHHLRGVQIHRREDNRGALHDDEEVRQDRVRRLVLVPRDQRHQRVFDALQNLKSEQVAQCNDALLRILN